MIESEIRRRLELHLCARLGAVISGHQFLPHHGGDGHADGEAVLPPFTVVSVVAAEKAMATEGTWIARGVVQVVTHIHETTTPAHSKLVRRIYAALGSVEPETSEGLVLHGIDIGEISESDSPEARASATLIVFSAGVGG